MGRQARKAQGPPRKPLKERLAAIKEENLKAAEGEIVELADGPLSEDTPWQRRIKQRERTFDELNQQLIHNRGEDNKLEQEMKDRQDEKLKLELDLTTLEEAMQSRPHVGKHVDCCARGAGPLIFLHASRRGYWAWNWPRPRIERAKLVVESSSRHTARAPGMVPAASAAESSRQSNNIWAA